MTVPVQAWWDSQGVAFCALSTLIEWMPIAYDTGEAFEDVPASARVEIPSAPGGGAYIDYGLFNVPVSGKWFVRQKSAAEVQEQPPYVMVDAEDSGVTMPIDDGTEITGVDVTAWVVQRLDQADGATTGAEILRARTRDGARIAEYYLTERIALKAREIDVNGAAGIIAAERLTAPTVGPAEPLADTEGVTQAKGYATVRVWVRRLTPVGV